MAATGFSMVVCQALDAPVVMYLMSPLPEVTTIKGGAVSSYQHIGVTSLPYQSRYDIVLTSISKSPGKRRECADPSL